MSAHYFFNLTDGVDAIRDEDGIELADIDAALVQAMTTAEELLAADPSLRAEWQVWWLEVSDSSGRIVGSLPLDALAAKRVLRQ